MKEKVWRDGDDGQPFVENPFNKGKRKKVDLVGMAAQGIKDRVKRYDFLGGNKISRRVPESQAEANEQVLRGVRK